VADEPKWVGEGKGRAGKDVERFGDDVERRSRWTPKRVVSAGLIAVLVVLVLQNTNTASLHLLLFTVSFPLWLLLGGMVVVSFLAGWLFGSHRRRRDD
jgi:uncharacterized integral membrane protein